MLSHDDPAWRLIARHYGDRRARRSAAFLLRHIEQGLAILKHLDGSTACAQAWSIHPLVQDPVIWEAMTTDPSRPFAAIPDDAMALAVGYRDAANAFLSADVDVPGRGPGPVADPEVRAMLVADKVQNRADFERHHLGVHLRSDALVRYFRLWLDFLDVDEARYADLVAIMSAVPTPNERVRKADSRF